MLTSTPLFVGGLPGGMEWAVILLIAVLLFGANKIPKLARSTGQAMGEFQRGREEIEDELEQMREGETESSETDTTSTASDVEDSPDTASTDTASDSETTN
jgi:sec-independent protein translocase protein TatA